MMTIDKTIEAIVELPDQPMIRCRDCADDGPFCPNRGMPCSLTTDDIKVLAAELKELREFLDNAMLIQLKGDTVIEIDTDEHGDGKWHICDEWGYVMPPGYETAFEAFDAWRKMNAG